MDSRDGNDLRINRASYHYDGLRRIEILYITPYLLNLGLITLHVGLLLMSMLVLFSGTSALLRATSDILELSEKLPVTIPT